LILAFYSQLLFLKVVRGIARGEKKGPGDGSSPARSRGKSGSPGGVLGQSLK